MLKQLDMHSSDPVYTQIEKQVQFAIASGQLKSGDALPTVGELSERLNVNFNTVAKAYRDLQIMGWVNTQRYRGVFVSKDCEERCRQHVHQRILEQLSSRVAEGRAAGLNRQEIIEVIEQTFAE